MLPPSVTYEQRWVDSAAVVHSIHCSAPLLSLEATKSPASLIHHCIFIGMSFHAMSSFMKVREKVQFSTFLLCLKVPHLTLHVGSNASFSACLDIGVLSPYFSSSQMCYSSVWPPNFREALCADFWSSQDIFSIALFMWQFIWKVRDTILKRLILRMFRVCIVADCILGSMISQKEELKIGERWKDQAISFINCNLLSLALRTRALWGHERNCPFGRAGYAALVDENKECASGLKFDHYFNGQRTRPGISGISSSSKKQEG